MDSRSYAGSLVELRKTDTTSKSKLEDFDEVQILISLAYRALYGKDLKKVISNGNETAEPTCSLCEGVLNTKDSEERIEELNLLKKLIFSENWKLKQLMSTTEFKEAYEMIFLDKNNKEKVPFDANRLLEQILCNFGAQLSCSSSTQNEEEIEFTKKNLREITQIVSLIRNKLGNVSENIQQLSNGNERNSFDSQSISLKIESDESLEDSSDKKKDDSCSKVSDSDRESGDLHKSDIFLSEDDAKREEGAMQCNEGSQGNEPDEDFFKPKRRKPLLKKSVTNLLKNWILENIENPYPSEETKRSLCEATDLSRNQLQNWFTNTRKRFLKPIKQKLESIDTSQFFQKNEKDLEQNLSIQRQSSDSDPSVSSSQIHKTHHHGQSSVQPETIFYKKESLDIESQVPPAHNQGHLIQTQPQPLQNHQILPQNYPVYVQGQGYPTDFMRTYGMQPSYPMPNFSTMPMQPLFPQWVAPNQQPLQQMPLQAIPQYPTNGPVQVIPVYMVMQPKGPHYQPISSVPMNHCYIMPVATPTVNSESHKTTPNNNFIAMDTMAAHHSHNGMNINTLYPVHEAKETNIGCRPELPLESAYGYKKMKM